MYKIKYKYNKTTFRDIFGGGWFYYSCKNLQIIIMSAIIVLSTRVPSFHMNKAHSYNAKMDTRMFFL